MLTIDQFMAGIAENEARIRAYKLKCDGTGGNCDCIGLIIGAVRLAGGSWPWTHGSNYTARYLLADGIRKDAPLQLGDLVFKARAPGEAGYALPSRYKDSPDRLDYYHVGVVTRINPLCITHCTSVPGGIKRDSTRGKWLYSGWLKIICIGRENKMTKYVYADSGKTVNLRKGAGVTYPVIAQVPIGAEISVQGATNTGWSAVKYGEKTGYMMTKFLRDAQEQPNDGGPDWDDTRKEAYAHLHAARLELDAAMALLSNAG